MDEEIEKQALKRAEKVFSVADEKSRKIIREYIDGGYKKTLETLKKYLEGPESTEPEVIAEAASVLKKSGFYGSAMSESVLGELSNSEVSAYRKHENEFFKKNPVLALNVENDSFVFDELVELDDRSIQRVLREVDSMTLTRALKGAKAVAEKIFRNMSRRAAEMLSEDMEFMGPVRICDIESARSEIIKIVKRLESNGEIVITGYNDAMLK